MSPEDAGKLLAFLVKENMRCPAPASPPPGRRAVLDFNQERVLDRLLVYERRIEHSLYRTMAELRLLRRLREQGGASSEHGRRFPKGDCYVWGHVLPMTFQDIHGQDARATHGRDAHATEPEGGTPNGTETNRAKRTQFARNERGQHRERSVRNEPNLPGSLKCEVGSLKHTSNLKLST